MTGISRSILVGAFVVACSAGEDVDITTVNVELGTEIGMTEAALTAQCYLGGSYTQNLTTSGLDCANGQPFGHIDEAYLATRLATSCGARPTNGCAKAVRKIIAEEMKTIVRTYVASLASPRTYTPEEAYAPHNGFLSGPPFTWNATYCVGKSQYNTAIAVSDAAGVPMGQCGFTVNEKLTDTDPLEFHGPDLLSCLCGGLDHSEKDVCVDIDRYSSPSAAASLCIRQVCTSGGRVRGVDLTENAPECTTGSYVPPTKTCTRGGLYRQTVTFNAPASCIPNTECDLGFCAQQQAETGTPIIYVIDALSYLDEFTFGADNCSAELAETISISTGSCFQDRVIHLVDVDP